MTAYTISIDLDPTHDPAESAEVRTIIIDPDGTHTIHRPDGTPTTNPA